jgi:hypothetical protein
MKIRYYVQQSGDNWIVLDRLKIKMHNDVVATFPSRREARAKAKELNDQDRPSVATEEVRHDTRPD